MTNPLHREIVKLIRENSGTPTQHTFLDSYLGNTHPRYPINIPTLRTIMKAWMRQHKHLSASEFTALLTALIQGESSTEKISAGILLGYATREQQDFDPGIFDPWLDELVGWAEVDAVCTGSYTVRNIPENWRAWRPLLKKFSRSGNMHKRRASLVLLCSPLSRCDDKQLVEMALENTDRLKHEKEVLITKAISWVLRSAIKYHKLLIKEYIQQNPDTLPKIALRETRAKLTTGRKTR